MADNEDLGLGADDGMENMENGQETELVDDSDVVEGDTSVVDGQSVVDPVSF